MQNGVWAVPSHLSTVAGWCPWSPTSPATSKRTTASSETALRAAGLAMALHGTVASAMVGGPESGSDQVRFTPGRQSYPSISREVPGCGSFLFIWLLVVVVAAAVSLSQDSMSA